MRILKIEGILILVLSLIIGCSAPSSESLSGSISGVVVDSSGNPVEGAVVIAGESSLSTFTDEEGRFTLNGLAEGDYPLQILVPGYFAPKGMKASTGQTDISIRIDKDPDFEKVPLVSIDKLTPTDSSISISVTVTPPVGVAIEDVRAEVIGTKDGAVLSRVDDNTFSGTIFTSRPEEAVVMVFAIDSNRRHGEDIQDVQAKPAGSISGRAEKWVGSVRGFHPGGFNHSRYWFNSSLTVTPEGDVNGVGVSLRLFRLKQDLSPLLIENFTGTAKVLGVNYKLTLTNPDESISLTLIGRVKEDYSIYHGFVRGKIADKPYFGRFFYINTEILPNPWDAKALSGRWGLSFAYRNQLTLSPSNYQYNVLLNVDESGNVLGGEPCTLGPVTADGASLTFVEVEGEELGYFKGSPGLLLEYSPSNIEYIIHGLMGIRRRHVAGVWSSTGPTYGIFWGTNRSWWDSSHFDAQWQGIFVVTDGPDAGGVLNVQVNINSKGEVTGVGSIVPIPGSTLSGGNISLNGGSLSFYNLQNGAVVGSFTGSQEGGSVMISLSDVSEPASASMGVYHGRIIGMFLISSNADRGYYILFRCSRNR